MLIDQFIEYESKKNLFQLDINGFKYWHFVRRHVYDEILNQRSELGASHTSHSKDSYAHRLALKLKQIPNWVVKNPFLFLKQKDMLVLNHSRKVKNNDVYECIYTDEYLKKTNHSYIVFEYPHLEQHFEPSRTDHVRYLDYFNFKIAVHIGFAKLFHKNKFKSNQAKGFIAVLEEIENEFEVSLNKESIVSNLEISYLSYEPTKKQYRKILKKVDPKVIIELVSYVRDRLIINEVAKELNIPVVELQHGTMGKHHIAYNFIDKMDLPNFPDFIFSFGKFWSDSTRFPISQDNIKNVGWPYFEKKVNDFADERSTKTKKIILFISQGTIGKELSKLAVELSESIDLDKYTVIYKLHPGEYDRWVKEYPWLSDAHIEVIDTNKRDMHYYFAKADIQIGVYSTALFEGLAYGLTTYIVKLFGHETMQALYGNNYAELVDTSKEIVHNIENDRTFKKIDANYFWQNNSMALLEDEITKLISESTK